MNKMKFKTKRQAEEYAKRYIKVNWYIQKLLKKNMTEIKERKVEIDEVVETEEVVE
jgi:hypothetical protein